MNIELLQNNFNAFVKYSNEIDKDTIDKTRKKRKGYETFCDSISCMTTEELEDLAKTKVSLLHSQTLSAEKKEQIKGELARIRAEYSIPFRTPKKHINPKWYENYAFLISYGVSGSIEPVGDMVFFKHLELHDGSIDIETFENLSYEEKKKSLEAVFSNKKDDLRLNIPVGSLMELRDIFENYSAMPVDNEKNGDIAVTSISLDDLNAFLQSNDIKNGKNLLGTNYRVFPFDLGREKERTIKPSTNELER